MHGGLKILIDKNTDLKWLVSKVQLVMLKIRSVNGTKVGGIFLTSIKQPERASQEPSRITFVDTTDKIISLSNVIMRWRRRNVFTSLDSTGSTNANHCRGENVILPTANWQDEFPPIVNFVTRGHIKISKRAIFKIRLFSKYFEKYRFPSKNNNRIAIRDPKRLEWQYLSQFLHVSRNGRSRRFAQSPSNDQQVSERFRFSHMKFDGQSERQV